MSNQLIQYLPLVIGAVIVALVTFGMLILNAILGPRRPSKSKQEPFECGNEPADSSRKRFSVKFYVVAIFFVVFDIEAVFLFPWAVMYRDLLQSPVYASIALAEILVFTGVLALGLWYVWRKGALDWAFERTGTGGGYE